jgi:hypothetical protein
VIGSLISFKLVVGEILERRSILLNGRVDLDEEPLGLGSGVTAAAVAIVFLTTSIAAAPAVDAFEFRCLAPLAKAFGLAGTDTEPEQLWSPGNR